MMLFRIEIFPVSAVHAKLRKPASDSIYFENAGKGDPVLL